MRNRYFWTHFFFISLWKSCQAESFIGCDENHMQSGDDVNTQLVKVQENVTIEGVQPFHQQNVVSYTECALSCQQKGCYITQLAVNGTRLVCLLFHYISNAVARFQPLEGSDVFRIDFQTECRDWLKLGYTKDGLYWIGIEGDFPIRQVFCDMTTYGGGWITIQRRFDGSLDFNRYWQSYKCGFGNIAGEHWLGLEFVHHFTTPANNNTEILLYGEMFDGSVNAELFAGFSIGGEETDYRLVAGHPIQAAYEGNWLYHDEMRFSSPDIDKDHDHGIKHCAAYYRSGWWYKGCSRVNFNTPYSNQSTVSKWSGVHWDDWTGGWTSLKETKMLMRRKI